jgi:hypothetical protein
MPLTQVEIIDEYQATFNDTRPYEANYKLIGELFTEAVSVLPFRVSFTSLDYAGYSPDNPAPIGIAVIGFNNYIL